MIYVSNSFIRKIDDLGRVVIPKEIRNRLNIQDNENIKIECFDNVINISKFSYLDNYVNFIRDIGNIFYEIYGICYIVYDRDGVVFSSSDIDINDLVGYPIIINSVEVGKVYISCCDDNRIGRLFSKILSVYLIYKKLE